MIKEYTISNFKAFSTPATLPIKPITLIYGANSAGKSSIFQSLLMLKQSLKCERESINEEHVDSMLVVDGKYINLKSFKNILHQNKEGDNINFEFCFSTDKLHELFTDIVLPSPTLKLMELFLKKSNSIKFSFSFSNYFENFKDIITIDMVNVYIDSYPDPIIQYENNGDPGDLYFLGGIITNHPFFKTYWSEIGKDRSVSILKKIINHIRKNIYENSNSKIDGECLNSLCINDNNVFTHEELEEISSCIDNNEEFLKEIFEYFYSIDHLSGDSQNLFEFTTISEYANKFSHCIDRTSFFNSSLTLKDIIYGKNKEIYDSNPFGYKVDDKYLSDNLVVFFMLMFEKINLIVKNVMYIGPFRDFFGYSLANCKTNMTFQGPINDLYETIKSNKFVLLQVNKYLSSLNIPYNISLLNIDHDTNNFFELALQRIGSNNYSSLTDVGFGVSQILPVIMQCIVSTEESILIEQPELHLHPALQAELGDLFIDSAMQKKNTLMIETHSEHVLLRIMRRIRETTNGTLPEGVTPIRAEDVSVVYVESVETDGDRHSIIREMPLNDQGELIKAWPGGFFEEGLREVF